MRCNATLNERSVHRTFRKEQSRRLGLTVIDNHLPQFGFTIANDGTRTPSVRASRPVDMPKMLFGTVGDTTATEARERAVSAIATAKVERASGLLFFDLMQEFVWCQRYQWKTSTRKRNAP